MSIPKKVAATASAAALALTLCLGLAGCGPDKGNFTGTWHISTMDGASVDQSGSWAGSADMTITLNEDGTAALATSSTSLFGNSSESVNATWEAKSDSECSITDDEGGTVTGKLDEGTLTIDEGGTALTFKRA